MQRSRFNWLLLGTYLLLCIGAVATVYPFLYMLMNSVKPGSEILNQPLAWPSQITLSGYVEVFRRLKMLLLFKNTMFLAVSITIINTLLSALAGYAIAKIPFPGRTQLFAFMLFTMMIPGALFLIPGYVIIYNLGWVGSFKALIIPSAVSVFSIFLCKQFMETIPNELSEAARIDGASEFRIFWSVVLPLSRPVLAVLAILNFMGSWNDFFGPLLYLSKDPNLWTLQLGLQQFQGTVPGENAQEIWAATTLVTVPLIVLFFFLQDEFVKAYTNVNLK